VSEFVRMRVWEFSTHTPTYFPVRGRRYRFRYRYRPRCWHPQTSSSPI